MARRRINVSKSFYSKVERVATNISTAVIADKSGKITPFINAFLTNIGVVIGPKTEILTLSLNQTFTLGANLRNIIQNNWQMGLKHCLNKNTLYVLGTFNDVVVCVYRIISAVRVPDPNKNYKLGVALQVSYVSSAEEQIFLYNKVPPRKRGAANPVRYYHF